MHNRARIWLVVKSALAVACVGAVGWQFVKLLSRPELVEQPPTIRFEYLLPAGFLYLAAHTVWATFFTWLLRSQGYAAPWTICVRAYFVSQFGKYVPGKAWVIFLRMIVLKPTGLPPTVVGVTATYEALVSMAAGAGLGILLLPWAGLGLEFAEGSGLWWGLIAIAGLPVGLGVLNKLVVRITRKARGPDVPPLPSPPVWMLAAGLLQAVVGWCLLGASLWLTVCGVAPEIPALTPTAYFECLAAVTLSYVVGFVVLFAPGGIGAREAVLQQVLVGQLGGMAAEPLAAVVALVLRLVWTTFEVILAGSLWWFGRPTERSDVPHD